MKKLHRTNDDGMNSITIYSDLICPWCYIGKRRMEEAQQDAIREITEALYLAGRTEDARLIEEALWDREACRAKDLRHQPSQRRVHTARVCCSARIVRGLSFPGPQAQAFSRGHLMIVATLALKTPSPLPKHVFKQLHLQLTLL